MQEESPKEMPLPVQLAAWAAGAALLLLAGGESEAQTPRDANAATARGRVERLTTGPAGEVDGAVLDDGTVLHWPPHLQNRFRALVRKGERVRAAGRTETGPAGESHFEVRTVTNLDTNATAENPDFASAPAPVPARIEPGLPPNQDQRIRNLEEQVRQLRQDVDRLRRER